MFNSNSIANYVIFLANQNNIEITQLHLHKVMFLLQLRFVNTVGELLFDEEFEAWKHGPVLLSQRYRFKEFGSVPINISIENVDLPNITQYDEFILQALRLNAWQLVDFTHKNPLWLQAINGDKIINNSDIINVYGGNNV